MIEGPVLDAIKAAKEAVWWSGFAWGVVCGALGAIFLSLFRRNS